MRARRASSHTTDTKRCKWVREGRWQHIHQGGAREIGGGRLQHIHTCSRYVSLEFLNGMCLESAYNDITTSPRADNDLLMFWASRCCCPATPDRERRSEPARSIKWSLEAIWFPVPRWVPCTEMESTQCDRDECSLQLVAAVVRFYSKGFQGRGSA